MINFTTILPEILTLVGIRSTRSIKLSTSLETSDSGLYANALSDVSLDLIKSVSVLEQAESKNSGVLTVGNWYKIISISGGADFTNVGASTTTVNLLFEATATTPTWGDGSLSTQPVIDYLNLVRTDETQSILNQFVSVLQRELNIQEIKVNDKLIHQTGTIKKVQNETAKGIYFELANSNSLKMVMKSLSLQLDSIETIRLYLYKIGTTEAIFTHDYTSKVNQVDFETLTDWEFNYQDNDNVGKEYLLLYYDYDSDNAQSDIQLESDTEYYVTDNCFESKHNNFVFFSSIEIPKSNWVWNAVSSEYDIPAFENTTPLSFCTSTENGLNINYNVTCDITQVLIDNKIILSRMIQYAYANRILTDTEVSNRSNRNERVSKAIATKYDEKYHILNHGENVSTGTKIEFVKGEILRVVENFKNIDCKCFNQNKSGVTISNSYQNNTYKT